MLGKDMQIQKPSFTVDGLIDCILETNVAYGKEQ